MVIIIAAILELWENTIEIAGRCYIMVVSVAVNSHTDLLTFND